DHDQCPDSACNLLAGNCMDPAAVVHVDGDGGQDYTTLTAALDDFVGAPELTIIFHRYNNDNAYQESVDIAGTVALLAAPGEEPRLQGNMNPAALTVTGTLFMRGVRVQNGSATGISIEGGSATVEQCTVMSNAGVGISLTGGSATVERSKVINNPLGGILVDGGGMLGLVNSFAGGDQSDQRAVDIADGSGIITYSTLAA